LTLKSIMLGYFFVFDKFKGIMINNAFQLEQLAAVITFIN